MNQVEAKQLRLSLKRKWFEMTAAGIKTEDYREINSYWANRLLINSHGKKESRKYWRIFDCTTSDNWVRYIINASNVGKTTFVQFDANTMTLGYPSKGDKSRILLFEHAGIEIRTGNPEWGAEPNKLYFVIKHGARI